MEQSPDDLRVAVAILHERMTHVIARLDEAHSKLDRRFASTESQALELEVRIDKLEADLNRARGFLFGLAAAGGVVGGGIASALAQVLNR